MIYPQFLKQDETIGICAPSAGVGEYPDDFDASLKTLKKHYRIKETAHVREAGDRGGDAMTRGKEFNELVNDPEVKMIMAASGGDFLNEMIPYIDFEAVKQHPKWILGASDPTGILFPITTMCDIATLYGCNAGSFDPKNQNEMSHYPLDIIQGNIPVQHSSQMHSEKADFPGCPARCAGSRSGECCAVIGRAVLGCIRYGTALQSASCL